MGWVYLDDNFVDHPKIDRAGGDAGWLYVCGLSYARRNGTDGVIPKHRLSRLSDRSNPEELASTLVKVGLWAEKKDHYEIHDYGMWNAKAERRRVQAQAAARKRWEREKAEADAMRAQMREHEQTQMHPHDDEHMQGQDDEHVRSDAFMGLNPKPHPDPHPQSSSSSESDLHAPPETTDDDDQDADNSEERVWRIWAERDRERLIAETGKHPHDDEAWLTSVAEKRRSRHHEAMAKLFELDPNLTAGEAIDRLEKVEERHAARPHPIDSVAAAARANMTRERPDCPDCDGSGWREPDGDGNVVRCTHPGLVAS